MTTSTTPAVVVLDGGLSNALAERGPQTMRVDLEAIEATGRLEDSAGDNFGTPAEKGP